MLTFSFIIVVYVTSVLYLLAFLTLLIVISISLSISDLYHNLLIIHIKSHQVMSLLSRLAKHWTIFDAF